MARTLLWRTGQPSGLPSQPGRGPSRGFPCPVRRGPGVGAGQARVAYRDGAGCCCSSTATLVCAYRDRSPVPGRMVPLTPDERSRVRSQDLANGDRSCHGERPVRRQLMGWGQGVVSAHTKPGELAATAVAASAGASSGRSGPVPGVQPALRLPGAGQGAGVRACLLAPQRRPDRGSVLVGPGGLGQRGAHRLKAGLGDVPAAGRRRRSTRRGPPRCRT